MYSPIRRPKRLDTVRLRASHMLVNRTNENWVKELRDGSAAQDTALTDLRGLLMSGLHKPFRDNPGVDHAFIEDVVQEALVKVLKSLDQFEGRSRFTTWATAIAIRLAYTELRRLRWKDVSLDEMLENAGAIPKLESGQLAGPEQEVQRKALIKKMYEIINQGLTDKQRDALLAELKGMPQEEIGRRMGSSRNAVYKLTHDARKRLKTALESSGYTLTEVQAAFGG